MKKLLAILVFGLLWCNATFAADKDRIFILDVNFCKADYGRVSVTLASCEEFMESGTENYVKTNIIEYKKNVEIIRKKNPKHDTNFCLRKDSSKISKSLINKLMPTIFSCEILGEDYAQVEFDGEKFYTYEQTQTDDNSNVVQQIKDLKELYDSGALTEEEFNKAKKKLLN